ncbi:17213_t:CDS:2, partial [Gigaspora rosea]
GSPISNLSQTPFLLVAITISSIYKSLISLLMNCSARSPHSLLVVPEIQNQKDWLMYLKEEDHHLELVPSIGSVFKLCSIEEVKKEVQEKTLNMAVVQEAQNLGLTLPLIPDNAVSKTRDIQVEEFEYDIYYYGQQFKKNN